MLRLAHLFPVSPGDMGRLGHLGTCAAAAGCTARGKRRIIRRRVCGCFLAQPRRRDRVRLTASLQCLYSRPMNDELAELEQKVEQVLALCSDLRAENQRLQVRMAGLEIEKQRLSGKVESARARLESLMEKLPQA
jgi:cell division protein ZapB